VKTQDVRLDGAALKLEDGTVDAVISTLALGFHFPWTTYRDEILRVLRGEGVLILDVRRGTDQLESLLESFDEVAVIARGTKHQRLVLVTARNMYIPTPTTLLCSTRA
jgi:hypothetical protein